MRGNRKTTFDALFIASVMAVAVFAQSPPRKTIVAKSSRASIAGKAGKAGAVADFQRDPVRLVEEFSLDEKTRHLAFDLALTVAESLGPETAARLTAKQRAALKTAFNRVVAGIRETWNADEPEPIRVLERNVNADRAVLTVLRGEELLRIRLASRNGAWFITEHEILDEALAEFADAFAGVLRPGTSRAPVYEARTESAQQMADALIASQGEKPELLLMKYRLLDARQFEQAVANPDRAPIIGQSELADRLDRMLTRLTTRWPDFAPGRLARGRALLYSDDSDAAAISPLSQDAETAIAELKAYAQLAPYDPRPHRDLAHAFEQLEKLPEAETALRRAIEIDPAYLNHHRALVVFLLLGEEAEKARAAFARMLTAASDPDAAFEELRLEYGEEKPTDEDGRAIEALLLAFPKEMEGSYAGWALLALARTVQNKFPEAVKSLQRAMTIETIPDDYAVLSTLYRAQRRFPEALNAADQAIRLDAALTDAHLERACSLAQLGRKRESLAALKQILKIDPEGFFFPDEPDLQPLAALPEFKAIVERMKYASALAQQKNEERKPKAKNVK